MADHYEDYDDYDSDDLDDIRDERKKKSTQYNAEMRRKIEKKLERRRLRNENNSYGY